MGIQYSKQLPSKGDLLKNLYELKKDYLVAEKYNISTMLLKKWKEDLGIPRKRCLVDRMYEEEYLHIVREEKAKRHFNEKVIQIDKKSNNILNVFDTPIKASEYIKENFQPFNSANNIATCIHNCLLKNV